VIIKVYVNVQVQEERYSAKKKGESTKVIEIDMEAGSIPLSEMPLGQLVRSALHEAYEQYELAGGMQP
jgi:fatty acid-binding protein DegV